MKITPRRGLARWIKFWLGPADPIRLEAFRVVTGLCLLAYLLAWWQHADEWLTTRGFHISAAGYRSIVVAPPLPPSALPWFGGLLFGGIAAFTLGWRTNLAAWVVLGGVTYVTVADVLAAYTINKLFIVSLAVLALVPLGSYWSLDQPPPPRARSVWPIRVLQATLLIQYFTAGWCKIAHGDWLQNPYVLWSQVQGIYRTDFAAWMLRVLPVGVWVWMQYAALTFELLSPFLFIVKRFRPIGFLWGGGFQLIIALTMHQLIYFSLQLVAFYVLFLDDSTLHALRCQLKTWSGKALSSVKRALT